MRKSIIAIALFLLTVSFGLQAANEPDCYVNTGKKVYFGNKIRIGLFNTKIVEPDGSVVKVRNTEVKSYMNGSKLFELKTITDNDPETPETAMLEYISARSGYTLYAYNYAASQSTGKSYFVFKDGKYFIPVTHNTAASILSFFGLKAF
jgi:hypothetical protein